ncbi:hypothetical protein SteCoe_2723 [Stentor coeruleus]|uniref:Uncharacterized protein n=1 Tax=Stentor coeruleus TaxID=5963 RepID=A0A1R2CZ26_9CILI|nr:hypothetical protein SteCoe_2723 [Stentor coeruleus]
MHLCKTCSYRARRSVCRKRSGTKHKYSNLCVGYSTFGELLAISDKNLMMKFRDKKIKKIDKRKQILLRIFKKLFKAQKLNK